MSTEVLRPADCRHITKLFREIPADVIAEGREWYPRARALAVKLACTQASSGVAEHEREVRKAAAVIAVLSPRLNWTKNLELAKLAYWIHSQPFPTGHDLTEWRLADWPGLKDGAAKAFRILDGEEPDDVVSGPKVRQFWHTIVDPTDPLGVVVDRHAIDVAFGRILSNEERGRALGKVGAYDHLSQLYRNAARIISNELDGSDLDPTGRGITPAEVQAITWTYWRRTRAANAKANRKTEQGAEQLAPTEGK